MTSPAGGAAGPDEARQAVRRRRTAETSIQTALAVMAWVLAGCAPPAAPPAPPPVATAITVGPSPSPTFTPWASETPEVAATAESIFPVVTGADWPAGPDEAPITFVAYCDFQSRGCAGLAVMLDRLGQEYPESIRRAFRHFPMVEEHDKAALAAEVAEAAGAQGRFWAMHDRLFSTLDDWSGMTPEEFRELAGGWAAELGLDPSQFEADLDAHAGLDKIDREYQRAVRAGIPGAPFLLINGEPYQGPGTFQSLDALVRLELLRSRQYPEYPAQVIERGKRYHAVIRTDKGDVRVELYPERAPRAVNSFVFLAQEGWFDGTAFHHVLPGFIARAGDPTGTGLGGPGYSFENEISPSLRFDGPGRVAMFNVGPGTNGSQFFITYSEQPNLTGNYTIFGQVIDGMDVVDALTPRNPDLDPPVPSGDAILSIEIREVKDEG